MKYDRHAISHTANRLKNTASGLSSIQSRLGNVAPKKCNSNFYAKRYSLVRRIRNVQSEIYSLSNDINSAANKMSHDDVQNARYIRQVFNNRASLLSFGNRGFSAGRTGLARTGLFGGNMRFSPTSIAALGGSTIMVAVWKNLANKFKSGATAFGNKISDFGKQAYNATTNFFSNAGKWASDRLNDFAEWGKSAKDYVWKSTVKFVLGDYDENNITVLSFAANIVTGIFDVDLPLDIRDLVYDIQHWGEGDNFGIYFALDCVALVPLIGVLKYCKYADDIADGAKDLGKAIETGTEVGKTIDNITEGVENTKDAAKAAGNIKDAGKITENTSDIGKNSDDLGKVVVKGTEIKYSKNSVISDDMEKKILEGKRAKEGSQRVIGGHSPIINDANPKYAVEVISKNADGTTEIRYVKELEDGTISSIKRSTIFPDTWNDSKIMGSINKVGATEPIGYRSRDGATLFRTKIDGVEIEVIKIGDKVTSAYPTGGGAKALASGFKAITH